jgi:hypothetical protein
MAAGERPRMGVNETRTETRPGSRTHRVAGFRGLRERDEVTRMIGFDSDAPWPSPRCKTRWHARESQAQVAHWWPAGSACLLTA